MAGDGVEQHGKGENVTRHEENEKQQLADTDELAPERTHKHLTSVGHAVDVGESLLELADDIACVPGDAGEAENEDDGGDNAECGHGGGERENAQRDVFSDHDCILSISVFCIDVQRHTHAAVPPGHGAIFDLSTLFISKRILIASIVEVDFLFIVRVVIVDGINLWCRHGVES